MVLGRTFILINTLNAISNPAISAATFEAPRNIDTGSMHVAVMSPSVTLVDICAACGPLLDKVS